MSNIMLEEIERNLIKCAIYTNDNATYNDIYRNHVNYGATTAYANILRRFGVNVDVPVYEDNGFLKIPKVLVNMKIVADFEKSVSKNADQN